MSSLFNRFYSTSAKPWSTASTERSMYCVASSKASGHTQSVAHQQGCDGRRCGRFHPCLSPEVQRQLRSVRASCPRPKPTLHEPNSQCLDRSRILSASPVSSPSKQMHAGRCGNWHAALETLVQDAPGHSAMSPVNLFPFGIETDPPPKWPGWLRLTSSASTASRRGLRSRSNLESHR